MQTESERNHVTNLAPLTYPALVVLNLEHLNGGHTSPLTEIRRRQGRTESHKGQRCLDESLNKLPRNQYVNLPLFWLKEVFTLQSKLHVRVRWVRGTWEIL